MKLSPFCKSTRNCITALLFLPAFHPAHAAPAADGVTLIEIKDTVKVPDVRRFGINVGGDSYYTGAMMKRRVIRNFEGTSYRQIFTGPADGLEPEGFCTFTQVPVKRGWPTFLVGADATILSGQLAGTRVKIREIAERERMVNGKPQKMTFFAFDQPVALPADAARISSQGLMVEKLALDEGQIGPVGSYWASDNCSVMTGDVPPGSPGRAVLRLGADKAQEQPKAGVLEAFMRFPTHYQRFGDTNGMWNVSFWAKAASGSPALAIKTDGMGEDAGATLTPHWQKVQLQIPVSKVPEPADDKQNPHLTFLFSAQDGVVLLDDVEIWKDGDTNPTPFMDDFTNALKELKPGIVRRLTMGGNTMENSLKPRILAFAFQNNIFADPGPAGNGPERLAFGLSEGLELCDYLGSEPWFCVPGTLHPEEMDIFMEFLAGATTTRGGKLRPDLGHPAPWTDSMKTIHVEFGNEAWNGIGGFLAGGYSGPDYWQGLISRAKASPYYKPGILFHAAGQNLATHMSRRILSETPAADRYSIAVYMVHSMEPAHLEPLDTEDKMFRWLFAYPLQTILAKGMPEQMDVSKQTGVEFSQYEFNYHITGGKAPLEPRNTMVSSIGGAVGITNAMLLMLKECHIRSQCFFVFQQISYDASGVGPVRLWGVNLSQRSGQVRFRPAGLALKAVNNVIGGNLVDTVQSGADPTFLASGILPGGATKDEIIEVEHPAIWSYAFAEGKRRGLVLVNLDTQSARPVELKFSGGVVLKSARQWLLASAKITDNNEFEVGDPQVALREEALADFASGQRLNLEPFSLRAISWEAE